MSANPRVLVLHPSADVYGADRALLEVVRQVRLAGWAAHVVLAEDGPLVGMLEQEGAEVAVTPFAVLRKASFQRLGVRRALLDLWRLRQPSGLPKDVDVVYASCLTSLSAFFVARKLRRPLVWHAHELVVSRWQRLAFGVLLLRASRIVTCSQSVRESLAFHTLRERSTVAFSGSRIEGIPAPRVLPDDCFHVACVARLNAGKGQGDLIAATAIARRAGVPVHAHIIGDAYAGQLAFETALREQVSELALTNHVTFWGWQDRPFDIVASCQAYVHPSRVPEPFGMSVIEAMALGLPVVATDAGGPREIIVPGVSGLLVDLNAPAQIAQALLSLHADPSLRQVIGSNARARAEHFHPSAMGRAVVKELESVAGTRTDSLAVQA